MNEVKKKIMKFNNEKSEYMAQQEFEEDQDLRETMALVHQHYHPLLTDRQLSRERLQSLTNAKPHQRKFSAIETQKSSQRLYKNFKMQQNNK